MDAGGERPEATPERKRARVTAEAHEASGEPGGHAAVAAEGRAGPRPPECLRRSPELAEMWGSLSEREGDYLADPGYLERHPQVKEKMRTMMADWLIEVCEEYTLQRETYHMAMNFFDRYFSQARDIQSRQIQLIGTTCIFISAKIFEIYPPELAKFVDLTDGACTNQELLMEEMKILKALSWRLSPVTAVGWVEVYLQTAALARTSGEALSLCKLLAGPSYSKRLYFRTCQLIDLATLDYATLRFLPGVLAAAALSLCDPSIQISEVSGYAADELAQCVEWMSRFDQTLKRGGYYRAQPRGLRRGAERFHWHTLQFHVNDMAYFKEAKGDDEAER